MRGRDGPVTYRSSPERVCPRVVPKKAAPIGIEMVKRRRTHERLQVEDVMPVGRGKAKGVSAAAHCALAVPFRRETARGGGKRVKRIKQNYKGAHARTHTHTPATLTHKQCKHTQAKHFDATPNAGTVI